MPPKSTDLQQDIMTQLALLNEQITSLRSLVEKSMDDHEARLRKLEDSHGETKKDLAQIRERMTIFNLLQGALSATIGMVVYWIKK